MAAKRRRTATQQQAPDVQAPPSRVPTLLYLAGAKLRAPSAKYILAPGPDGTPPALMMDDLHLLQVEDAAYAPRASGIVTEAHLGHYGGSPLRACFTNTINAKNVGIRVDFKDEVEYGGFWLDVTLPLAHFNHRGCHFKCHLRGRMVFYLKPEPYPTEVGHLIRLSHSLPPREMSICRFPKPSATLLIGDGGPDPEHTVLIPTILTGEICFKQSELDRYLQISAM